MIPTEVDWLDGPGFVAWLGERRQLPTRRVKDGAKVTPDQRLTNNDKRRIQDWKNGAAVHYYTADNLATRLGLVAATMPEEIALPDRNETHGGWHPIDKNTRRRVIRAYRRKGNAQSVGAKYGVHPETVRRWANA